MRYKMAKTVGPLLSMQARGSIGNALTFGVWKGKNTVRIKSTPSNPKTSNQMKVRAEFSVGGKFTKISNPEAPSPVYLKGVTPAGLAWNSHLGREMVGSGGVNIADAKAQYDLAGNATVKGYFDTVAATAGIETIDLDGTANTQLSRGLVLAAAYLASQRLGVTTASTAFASLTQANITAFVASYTTV